MLSDGDLIRNLLGLYCRLIDAGDFAAVGRLFAAATVCTEDGSVVAAGADQVARLYADTTRRHADGTPMTQHVVANTVLEPLDEDTIRALSSYVVLQATDSLPLQPIVTGSYVDTFARTDGPVGWRFAERRITMGRAGDLSQHLGGALAEAGERK
ncbi:MAG: nuclear transport factor 2 family protein [Nocardioidaceae bacterium]|nr:nuclear transport factor 2 family protein [Nocardioidaceae bacterium]MCL2614356.1 nuclear transport factor 2 family protein [Nocardioidaceae bacterium]